MPLDAIDRDSVLAVLREIGSLATAPGSVLVCGGTSAILEGWRETTIDLDLSFAAEPGAFFEALAQVKKRFDISIDLLSPSAFVPLLPGAEERHELIGTYGLVTFAHFDFYTQALSKIQRGHTRDLADVQAMLRANKIVPAIFQDLFNAIEPELIRYPAIDPESLRIRLLQLLKDTHASD